MEFSLLMPADFPVGRYRMVVEVAPEGSKRGEEQDAEREVVVLFNPWCKGMKHMLYLALSALTYMYMYIAVCQISTYIATCK